MLEAYNKIWDKVNNLMKKGFDSEPVGNEKYLKNKIKLFAAKINTNFPYSRILTKGSYCVCLMVILKDSF